MMPCPEETLDMNPTVSTPRRRRLHRVAAVAAMALAATGIVAVPAGPAQADEGCLQVTLTVTTWTERRGGPAGDAGGYLAVYTLTNVCDTPVTGWTLDLVLPAGQNVGSRWSATWTISGQRVTATNQAWNATIAPGQSITFGYLGSWVGGYADPLSCAINGSPCDGGSPGPNEPPVVALTAPADGQGLNASCPVFLTADASDPDGSVDLVEFYVDGVLVGSDATAPYAFEVESGLSNAIEHTAFARAIDDGGASTDSAESGFLRLPPPPSLQLVACNPPGEIAAGTSEEIHYSKTIGGSAEVTLTVTGDPGISVSPTSFTLTTGTHVVVTAAPGSSGSVATITATAPGFGSSTVTVTVP
jgi:hypothetical protein